MKHSAAAPFVSQSSVLASHSYLPRICSICISFLVALSSVGASKAQSSVDLDTVAQTKQVTIVTNLPPGKVGVAYSGSVSIHGNSSRCQYSVSSGALPAGLQLNANTGAVSGIPTKAETSYLELRATPAIGPVATLQTQFTISGTPVPQITVTVSPLGSAVQSGGSLQFRAAIEGTSNTSVVWSAGAGSISDTGLFTAPKVTSLTTLKITATSVADSSKQARAMVSVTPTVSPLAVTTSTLASATVDSTYNTLLSGTGGTPPYTWSIRSGALPSGLQLESSTGMINGVPASSGSFSFSAALTDAAGQRTVHSLALSVGPSTSPDTCGPPTYNCSRSDSSFVPVPRTIPTWGGLFGTNTVVKDPDFHNPIVRVTDASLGAGNNFCTGLGGSGDIPQIWNADSTILLICNQNGAYFPIGFDPVNFRTTGPLYGKNPLYKSGGGTFSHTNPNLFYAFTSGKLQTIDYTNRTTPPTAQLLYDYANCGVSALRWQTNGGSDPTDTIFSAGFSTTGGQDTGVIVAAYNSSTGICFNLNTSTGVITKYPGAVRVGTINLPDRFTIHNVKMKGGTTLVVAPQNCIANCGAHPYAWVIGTTEMYALGSPKGGGHWAVGCGKWLNQPGDLYDYTVTRDYLNPALWNSVWPVSSSECGASPRMSCSQPFDSHPAWLGDCSDTGPVCMATVISTDVVQYPYQNEIICITTDGSNRQIRFSHTYSSMALQNFDAQWSIGGPSQDGRFYAWTTKAGGQFGCTNGTFNCALTRRRSDVLVVKLQ